ncbi:MAG: hypothetical protein KIS92_16700, partial [Planctomycetota bacterium]|nr:hypothetical protein [Planctomycetota bacterium]
MRTLMLAGMLAAALRVPAAETPANTWVTLSEEDSGAREWPAFWYDARAKRFIASAGMGAGKPHFDTEAFDPAAGVWTNLYPEGAPYKVERGPTDAPPAGIKDGEPTLKPDANGVVRVQRAYNAYGRDSNVFYQFARSDADGSVYAYLLETTMRFDPATRAWTDLKANRYSQCRGSWLIYGALAYDPVNNEIVALGGTSDEDGGTPGTWTYRIADNQWTKRPQGSAERKALNAQARALYARAAAFINACRNRFYVTETEAEAKQDLPAQAGALA